jgi:hypothetical protein
LQDAKLPAVGKAYSREVLSLRRHQPSDKRRERETQDYEDALSLHRWPQVKSRQRKAKRRIAGTFAQNQGSQHFRSPWSTAWEVTANERAWTRIGKEHNRREAALIWKQQPTQFLKLGERISSTKLKLDKFTYKTRRDPSTGADEDVSELTIINAETKQRVVLVLNKVLETSP